MENQIVNTPISTAWIENLAIEEINMDESGVVHFTEHLNPDAVIEESSIKLMDSLRDKFEIYTNRFNDYRGFKNANIRIFKISNTVNDFMLFRNSLRLVVARKNTKTISIGFLSNAGAIFSARLNNGMNGQNMIHEIKAHMGPFGKISWKFEGEAIDVDALVRHYLTEFIKLSAR